MIFRNLLLLALVYCPVAQARMYQWIDPDSGTTQLSGKPPVWYRSNEKGPRIIVIENGKVIDDTSIKVSDDVREILRQRAYMSVEENQSTALQKAKIAEKLKSGFESNQKNISTNVQQQEASGKTEILMDDTAEQPVEIAEPATDDEENMVTETGENEVTEEQMRARIQEWENQRTEEARKLLEPD